MISIVIPVYNEEEVLPELYPRLKSVMKKVTMAHEIIFVDDGSTDRSSLILDSLKKSDPAVQVLTFARNCGHQAGLTVGLSVARGDNGCHHGCGPPGPPELICEMLLRMDEGYDIVHATRSARQGETLFKRKTASAYYRILRLLGVTVLADTGDFRIMSRAAADALNAMPERRRFLRGMIPWMGFEQTQVYYERPARFAGKTKYSLVKMLRLAGDGIFSFSTLPVRIPLVLALLACVLRAWQSAMILFSIGFLGEYVLRIYDEVRARPMYIVNPRFEKGRKVNPLREKNVS